MSKALEYLISRPLAVTQEAADLAVEVVTRAARPEAVQARRGRAVDGTEAVEARDGVAVVPIAGPIFRYANWMTALCGGATVEDLARDLRAALDNPAIKAILLDVDSPGGEAAGIGELAGMIRQAAAEKPLVAYIGDEGCSAAYWLASAASEVVVAPTAIVGSIGVVMGYPTRGDSGRKVEFVSSQSPNKRPDVSTAEGRAEIQRVVDDLADVFVADVARNRGVAPATVVADFGHGGVLVGQKAVDAGMADRTGTFESTLAELAAGKVPARRRPTSKSTQAATGGATPEGEPPMFGLFRKKDGSLAIQPAAAEGDVAVSADVLAPATLPHVAATPAPAPAAEALAPIAGKVAQDELLAAVRQELVRAKADLIQAKAQAWYDGLFAADLIVPAEQEPALAAFVQASLDDTVSPLGDGPSRVALVQGLYRARTPHTLCREQLDGAAAAAAGLPAGAPAGAKALDHAGDAPRPPGKDRVNSLIGHLIAAGMASPDALAK